MATKAHLGPLDGNAAVHQPRDACLDDTIASNRPAQRAALLFFWSNPAKPSSRSTPREIGRLSIRRRIDKAVRFGSRAAEILQEFTGPKELDRGTVATTFDGKTLAECERQWESIGVLAAEGWRGIRDIGIYSVHLRKLVYIGRVVYRQGFHWRMQQYNSGSYAGNTTPAARRIHANRRAVEVKILRMKSVDATKALEKALIAKCAPPWNDHHNS